MARPSPSLDQVGMAGAVPFAAPGGKIPRWVGGLCFFFGTVVYFGDLN